MQNLWIRTYIHSILVVKNELEHNEKWYKHALEGAIENEEIKILWDINI